MSKNCSAEKFIKGRWLVISKNEQTKKLFKQLFFGNPLRTLSTENDLQQNLQQNDLKQSDLGRVQAGQL